MNRTTETAATANFVTDYGDGAWLIMYSNRRADGVLLEALIKADPKNDLIPKLVRGLLDQRVKGAWSNTQENVFILLALDKYFNAFEKVTPDFVTRIWLGNAYAGEQAFKGRSVDSNVLNIPMSYLTEQGGTSNLFIDQTRCRPSLLPNRYEIRAEKPETRSCRLRIYGSAKIRAGR